MEHTFDSLAAKFRPMAHRLAGEGVPTETIALRFYQYTLQKMSQQKARDREPVLRMADKIGI